MKQLRNLIIGLALTATMGFAGLSLLNTSVSDVTAGANHWSTDTDVG